jgi:hypothetical protein
MNNHDYNSAVFQLKTIPFLDNGFLMIREDETISSPISVLNYEFYDDALALKERLTSEKNNIQCIVAASPGSLEKETGIKAIPFGNAQYPQLGDYADGIDTMKFLTDLPD